MRYSYCFQWNNNIPYLSLPEIDSGGVIPRIFLSTTTWPYPPIFSLSLNMELASL